MSLLTLALIVAATNTAPNPNGSTTKTNSSKTTLKASKNTKGNATGPAQDPNAPATQDGAASAFQLLACPCQLACDGGTDVHAAVFRGQDIPGVGFNLKMI